MAVKNQEKGYFYSHMDALRENNNVLDAEG